MRSGSRGGTRSDAAPSRFHRALALLDFDRSSAAEVSLIPTRSPCKRKTKVLITDAYAVIIRYCVLAATYTDIAPVDIYRAPRAAYLGTAPTN